MHEANCSHAHPSYLQYCEGEGRSHPCPDIFTRERHDRDNRPPSLLPCPFLKAELKSFSTGVQRPPIPSPVRKRKGKKRRKKASHSRKRHEVTTTTTFGEYWCQPAAAEILLGFLPARATLPFSPLLHPRTTWCIATHLDRVQFFRPPTTYSTYVSHGRKILGGG